MADIGQKFGLSGGGGEWGIAPVTLLAGMSRRPPHLAPAAAAMTMTTGRYYAVPFLIYPGDVFAGATFRQSGDNTGESVKIAFYNQAAAGGLGTVAKDFGAVAQGGASAINNLASAWTPGVSKPTYFYGVMVASAASVVFGAAALVDGATAATLSIGNSIPMFRAMSQDGTTSVLYPPGGFYVAGTYANFPEANGLTLSTTLPGIQIGSVPQLPYFELYA